MREVHELIEQAEYDEALTWITRTPFKLERCVEDDLRIGYVLTILPTIPRVMSAAVAKGKKREQAAR